MEFGCCYNFLIVVVSASVGVDIQRVRFGKFEVGKVQNKDTKKEPDKCREQYKEVGGTCTHLDDGISTDIG